MQYTGFFKEILCRQSIVRVFCHCYIDPNEKDRMAGMSDERRELRADLITEVEFYLDTEAITAYTIDVSKSGLRLETDKPVKIRLRFKEDIIPENYHAQLVWAKESDSGSMEYGFKYVQTEENKP